MNQVFVKAVFDVRRVVFDPKQPLKVGLVFGKEQRRHSLCQQPSPAILRTFRCDDAEVIAAGFAPQPWPFRVASPGPGVSKPECRKKVERRGIGTAVPSSDSHQKIIRGSLGILDKDVKIAILLEMPVSSNSNSEPACVRRRFSASSRA